MTWNVIYDAYLRFLDKETTVLWISGFEFLLDCPEKLISLSSVGDQNSYYFNPIKFFSSFSLISSFSVA